MKSQEQINKIEAVVLYILQHLNTAFCVSWTYEIGRAHV